MRSQQTLPTQAIKAEKRLDALIKQEMREHQHLISGHNKEMQDLRNSLQLALEKFQSLSQKHDEDYKKSQIDFLDSISIMNVKIKSQELLINKLKDSLADVHRCVLDFQIIYPSQQDVENWRKYLQEQINEVSGNNIQSFQILQMELKKIINLLKIDLEDHKSKSEKKFSDLIDTIERNFNVTKIDREGVLNEIRVYEKTIFIIEKKIENIYTLIERINNRGTACHKPD